MPTELPEPLSPEEEPNLQDIDLSELQNSVTEYNRQYNFGTLMGEALIRSVKEANKKEEGDEGKEEASLPADITPPKLTKGDLEARHRAIVEATGIGFEPIRPPVTIYGVEEGSPQPLEMRMNLVNGSRFMHYLQALAPDRITESQRNGLRVIVESLTKQLAEKYELGAEDERLLELFGSLSQIIEEYRRLGREDDLGHSIDKLEEYLAVAREGYLREYIEAEQKGLLDTPQMETFGPARWHTDSTMKYYEEHWDDAIRTLERIGQNPKAREFAKTVVDRLRRSLEYARGDITQRRDYFEQYDEKIDERLALIDGYLQYLANKQ